MAEGFTGDTFRVDNLTGKPIDELEIVYNNLKNIGNIDILVNNVGGSLGSDSLLNDDIDKNYEIYKQYKNYNTKKEFGFIKQKIVLLKNAY